MGIIIVLCISICFLIFCIAKRPRYIETSERETAVITEDTGSADSDAEITPQADTAAQAKTQEPATQEDAADALQHGKTSTRVNIRNAPTEDGKVLDTVESGTTFDIIEVLDTGWTHIIYQDEDAYISSAYVIIIE